MFRQFPAVLAATVLLSGCGIMQSSEELVRLTSPWPPSQTPIPDVAIEDETSTPTFMLDETKHTNTFFDLLETPDDGNMSVEVESEPADIATSDDDGNHSTDADMVSSDGNNSTDADMVSSDDNSSTDADMVSSDDNDPAVGSMDNNNDKSSADSTASQSFVDISPAKNTVFFEFGSEQLNVNGRVLLDNFVEQLGNSELVELTGYTCNVGPEDFNQYLSRNRAQTVKAYLIHKGVNEDRIVTKGRGIENPVASNSEKATRVINRRVEMKVSP